MVIRQNPATRAVRAAVPLLATVLVACGPDPIVTPVRNLERPSDMDFVCMYAPPVAGTDRVTSGQPMPVCKDPLAADPPPVNINPRVRVLGTFGLVTNSARSEVGAIDLEAQRLIDLDPAIPGYNQVPVGALPESISTSDDGCRAVTANRGSCDLSVINTSRMLAPTMGATAPAEDKDPLVTTVRVKTDSGFLRSAPFEVSFVPTLSATQLHPRIPVEGAMPPASVGVTGPTCGGTGKQSWRAVVTFPSCDLVALVRFPEGKIISSVKVLADGQVVNAGTDPVCPDDCGMSQRSDAGGGAPLPPLPPAADAASDAADASVTDGAVAEGGPADAGAVEAAPEGGSGDDGGAGSVGSGSLGIGALAIMPGGDRLYVAGSRSEVISSVGIAPGDGGFLAVAQPPVTLSERAGGVTRLRLSFNPFGPPKPGGPFVGRRGQYLYAFARDGSVRVVEIGDVNGNPRPMPAECDVNVDPDSPGYDTNRGCYRVSEKFPRLLLEKGPGLRVPVSFDPDVAAPTPIDIAFSDLGTLGLGLLLSSNNRVYQILVDPGAMGVAAHRPRPATSTPGGSGGVPRIETEPVRDFGTTPVPFPTKVGFALPTDGPQLESYGNPARWMEFSERSTVRQSVQIRWEGILTGTNRLTGRLQANAGATGIIRDVGADYCRYSVEPGDVLGFTGCDQDRECNVNVDEICFRAAPGSQGTCLPRSFVANEPLVASCRTELASRRRYEILEVRKRQLVLGLKPDEVPRSSLTPCTVKPLEEMPGDECQPDGAHRADPTVRGDEGFRCVELKAGEPRCLKRCGVRNASGAWEARDEICRAGHVCADVGNASLGPICMEAPLPRPECTPREVSYRIHAGNSFLVRSEAVPHFVTTREAPLAPGDDAAAGGLCVRDPSLPKLFSQRISLKAPHCQSVSDGVLAGALTAASAENEPSGANACLFRGPNPGEPATISHVKALFENPHYRFILTNLEDYVGDAASVNATIVGGFSPLGVSPTGGTLIGLGARIVTGPGDSDDTGTNITDANGGPAAPPPFLFVVDQGRTLTQFSRGQVLRVSPRPLENLEGGYIDSIETDSLFPIQ